MSEWLSVKDERLKDDTPLFTNTWYQIYTIVWDNGSASGEIDEDDLFMEQLISSKLKQRKKET